MIGFKPRAVAAWWNCTAANRFPWSVTASACIPCRGAGFMGSALVRELLRRGERVRVVDNLATGLRRNVAEVLPQIEFFEVDITDLDRLRPAFDGVDYVLHQAALHSVPRSVDHPLARNR